MSSLVKAALAAALTLPLIAFVAGVLASPEAPSPDDRARPVIIGNVGSDVLDGPTLRPAPREGSRPDGSGDDRGSSDDDSSSDDGGSSGGGDEGPAVVIPPPRDVGDGDDDDGVGDDDDDDDDETDETDGDDD